MLQMMRGFKSEAVCCNFPLAVRFGNLWTFTLSPASHASISSSEPPNRRLSPQCFSVPQVGPHDAVFISPRQNELRGKVRHPVLHSLSLICDKDFSFLNGGPSSFF